MRGEWLSALAAHVGRLERQWDESAALDPTMLAAAQRLSRVLGDDADDLGAWRTLGVFYLRRGMARYNEDDKQSWDDDAEAMSDAFARCFVAGVDVPGNMIATAAVGAADTARAMLGRAMELPDAAPLTAVAHLWQRIIQAVPVGYPIRAIYLVSLSFTLQERFRVHADHPSARTCP